MCGDLSLDIIEIFRHNATKASVQKGQNLPEKRCAQVDSLIIASSMNRCLSVFRSFIHPFLHFWVATCCVTRVYNSNCVWAYCDSFNWERNWISNVCLSYICAVYFYFRLQICLTLISWTLNNVNVLFVWVLHFLILLVLHHQTIL